MADEVPTTTPPAGPPLLIQHIARNLRRLRQMHGYTQGELAQRAGVSRDSIHSIEVGRQPGLRVRTLEKLAKGLGENVVTLLWPCSTLALQKRGRRPKHHKLYEIAAE